MDAPQDPFEDDPRLDSGVPDEQRLSEDDYLRMTGAVLPSRRAHSEPELCEEEDPLDEGYVRIGDEMVEEVVPDEQPESPAQGLPPAGPRRFDLSQAEELLQKLSTQPRDLEE